MLTRVDERLRLEVLRFSLRFTCEDCAHFDTAGQRCAHGYPCEPHRAVDLAGVSELLFCKDFELI